MDSLVRIYKSEKGNYPPTLEAMFDAPPELRSKLGRYPYGFVISQRKLIPDGWGHAFVYRAPGTHNKDGFDLFSIGPDGIAGTADDIGNW